MDRAAWIENIKRIREIGAAVAKLSAESKGLRKLVGETAHHPEVGYHEPTRDNPLEVLLATPDPAVGLLVTITPSEDGKDWNVLPRELPICIPRLRSDHGDEPVSDDGT